MGIRPRNTAGRLWERKYYKRNRKHILRRVKKNRDANLEKYHEIEKKCAFKLKTNVFRWFGGKCVCCGEIHTQILTLDHILDNGSIHRKKEMGGKNLYRRIWRDGFSKKPKDLQLLCPNCQMGKKFGSGFCFHHPRKDLRVIR